MTDHHDVIAAFVDSEAVEAPELSAALAEPTGRDYLIDLLVLRGLVTDGATGRPGGRAARPSYVAGGLPPSRTLRRTAVALAEAGQPAGQSRHRGLWLTAAAALAAVGLAAGFAAGRMTTTRFSLVDMRVASDAPTPAETTTVAPAPTHVIRMEKGVDWNERSGGN